jgi:hypothetical protein
MDYFKHFMIILLFLLGMYYIVKYQSYEGFDNAKIQTRCPNILLQKGSAYFLYNSKVAKVPGVNPVRFNNLEEYTEFIDWQRGQGIRCPIMFVQESYDAQGNPVYNVRPSPTELHGGLQPLFLPSSAKDTINQSMLTKLFDAGHNDYPFNKNSFPSYDPQNQSIGVDTPLDKMFHDNTGTGKMFSPNPMDDNWGGQKYTQSLVDQGYYAGSELNIRTA